MKISIDTEKEEIEEIRHAIAILEDALNRREDSDVEYSEESNEEPEDENNLNEGGSYESPEEPEPQLSEPEPAPEQPPQASPEPPSVDLSALASSDYGQEQENRTMNNLSQPSEPEVPQQNNKDAIKEIINNLRNQNPGQPIQMSQIISKATEKNISEQDTRTLVSELQNEGSI